MNDEFRCMFSFLAKKKPYELTDISTTNIISLLGMMIIDDYGLF